MKAINIEWDVDYDGDGALLPTEIEIPKGMTDEDEITDYLSDVTGYCHKGYVLVEPQKYNEKEIFAAISTVEEIVNCEDFSIDIVEEDGELSFCLIDHQGVYLGDIGSDRFGNLGDIIGRMGIYHNDYFYNDYFERVDQGEVIPQDDWDRKVLMFLEGNYIADLLLAIDIDTYQQYKGKDLGSLDFNSGEKERYLKDGRFDFVGYLCDKSIAIDIMNTQSGYPMVEYDNRIFVAAHCDWYDSKESMLADLKAGEESFCNSFTNYGVVVETEQWQVKDDMYDIGLYDEKGGWRFYLTDYELAYIGLGDELKKYMEEERADVGSLVEDAKVRVDSDIANIGKDKSDVELEME